MRCVEEEEVPNGKNRPHAPPGPSSRTVPRSVSSVPTTAAVSGGATRKSSVSAGTKQALDVHSQTNKLAGPAATSPAPPTEPAPQQPDQPSKAQLEQQQKLAAELQDTEKRVAAAKKELEGVQEATRTCSAELTALLAKIADAKTSLSQLEQEVSDAKAAAEAARVSETPAARADAAPVDLGPSSSEEASAVSSPRSEGKKPKKKKSKEPAATTEKTNGDEALADILALAKSTSKSGLGSKKSPRDAEAPEDVGDRRTERSATVGGSPAGAPTVKRSKSRGLEKKNSEREKSSSSSPRRAVTSKKLVVDSLTNSPKPGALRRAVLLPNRELPLAELNAYYAAFDTQIRKAQALVRRFNGRKRVRRLSNVVKSFAESDQSLSMRQRNAALKEIFTTERTYSESLKKLVDIYIQPLKKQRVLDDDEMELMFGDIEVISDITSILLEKLEERLRLWPAVQKFGDIFRDSAPLMKLYYRYIRDFTKAQTRLGELEAKYPELKEILTKQNEKSGGLGLMGFLIMPVQRLPRYEMLLRALLKLTESTHVDFQNLTDALDAVVGVNQYINQRKKEEEIKAQIPQLLSKESQRKIKAGEEGGDKGGAVRYLKISIERARNLPAMDSNGLADPYCTIAYDGENMKTKTKKETLTPDWKEEFVLAILPNSPDAFTIAVIDYDRIGANEMMGWLEFKIADFLKTPEQAAWFPLQPPKGKTKKEKKKSEANGDSIVGNSAASTSALTNGELYLQFHYVKEV